MAGSFQDKDGDGKVAWYPDPAMPNEKPPRGQDPAKVEKTETDAPQSGSTQPTGTPVFQEVLPSLPNSSLSSPGETKAEIAEAFSSMFGDNVPKEIASAYYKELNALQASRNTKPVTRGGIDYITQGVSPQERKDILNKYLNQYATVKITAAANGDAKALAGLQRGTFGVAYTTLKNAYSDNGISYNLKSIAQLASESAINPDRLKSNINLINIQAKTLFPALSEKIDAGYTVKQLLNPYIQARANILEEDPDMVDVKTLAGVAKDPKNLMGLYDYEISLRKDPKWRFTKNAQDTLSNVASGIAKTFGLLG